MDEVKQPDAEADELLSKMMEGQSPEAGRKLNKPVLIKQQSSKQRSKRTRNKPIKSRLLTMMQRNKS